MSARVMLSICAIMKHEAPYLLEWLEFHKLVGVQKFYLYENGDGVDSAGILYPYLESGEVILYDWPIAQGQLSAYNHCLQTYSQASEWIAFIDLDEFLFPTEGNDLKEILSEFVAAPGVGVNWLMFGTSGHGVRPAGLQIENFTKRAETDFPGNQHIKSIVRPDRVFPPTNPHFFNCKNSTESTVTEEHLPLSSAITDHVSVAKLRINHYFTRSREDMYQKMLRGRACDKSLRTWDFLKSGDRNEVEDVTIQRFLPQLKQAIEAHPGTINRAFTVVSEVEINCDSNFLWTGYLEYPQINHPVYGSMLFTSGWLISKHAPVVAIRALVQHHVIAEISVNVSRPDVLRTYRSIAETNLFGFQGTLNLKQVSDQDIVQLEAVFADQASASFGYFKISKFKTSQSIESFACLTTI
jgi:hypothetical protein